MNHQPVPVVVDQFVRFYDGEPLSEAMTMVKRAIIVRHLTRNQGHQCKTASQLGMHRNTLSRAMAELGISPDTGRIRPWRKRKPMSRAVRERIWGAA